MRLDITKKQKKLAASSTLLERIITEKIRSGKMQFRSQQHFIPTYFLRTSFLFLYFFPAIGVLQKPLSGWGYVLVVFVPTEPVKLQDSRVFTYSDHKGR